MCSFWRIKYSGYPRYNRQTNNRSQITLVGKIRFSAEITSLILIKNAANCTVCLCCHWNFDGSVRIDVVFYSFALRSFRFQILRVLLRRHLSCLNCIPIKSKTK